MLREFTDQPVAPIWSEKALDALAEPRLRRVAAGTALAVASLTMLAWIFGLDGLLRLGAQPDLMRFNTALMLSLLAAAALLTDTRLRSWSGLPAAAAAIIATATLLQLPLPGAVAVDQLLLNDWTHPPLAPGRPSPYSAVAGLLLAAALLARGSSNRHAPAWGIAAAAAALVVAAIALMGAMGSFPLPSLQGKNMAVPTALVVALLGMTALGTLWGNDARPAAERRLVWLPVIAGSSALVGVILLWVLTAAAIGAGEGVQHQGATPNSTVFAILLLAGALSAATLLAVRHAILADITASALAKSQRSTVAQAQAAIEAAMALRETEQRFRATFENAAVGIAHVAPDGRWLRVNDKLCEVAGFSREELLTKSFQDITHPADLQRDLALAGRLLAGEIPNYSLEKRYRRKDGDIVWVNLTVSLVRRADGAPDYFISIVEDIRERKRAKQDLVDSQARLASLVESAAPAILTINVSGTIESVNSATEDLFAYGKSELLGRNVSILMPEPYYGQHDTYLASYLDTGTKKIIGADREVIGRRKDGTTFPIHLAVSEFEAKGQRYFTGIIHDLSDRKRVEEALIESERRLAQAQKMQAVGHLTGSLAHDFNNLLTVIGANLELLEQRLPKDFDMRLLHEAREAVKMGARLTERLLMFARKRRLEPAVIDLNERLLGMAELLRRTLGEAVEINLTVAPDLWPVRVDAGGIENAILNLALNARDAMPQGGKLIIQSRKMTLEEANPASLPSGDYVLLSVSDSGTGIPPEDLPHVFEPFFTTKESQGGTGLGLSSVYGFVKQSGGHASITSEVARGTTVNIYLPKVAEELAQVPELPERSAVAMAAGETILAVEDNPIVRRATVRRLEALGFNVVEAETALVAIKILASEIHVDLVFSDVVMPGGISGLDLARWIRTRRPDLKIVLTSGYADELASEDADLPDVATLRKPYSQAELMRTLRACLDA